MLRFITDFFKNIGKDYANDVRRFISRAQHKAEVDKAMIQLPKEIQGLRSELEAIKKLHKQSLQRQNKK